MWEYSSRVVHLAVELTGTSGLGSRNKVGS